jgi:hypothetical protein
MFLHEKMVIVMVFIHIYYDASTQETDKNKKIRK